ncbi:hypothetical protein [Porphyrobacter sp. LM 6]|uniref:hypothetical protein n=1 Tax=Porphyrobacter sp. LM 6 TaxID=1896196 RepID=UPI000847416D|nr:hypothetical protein [Porphyrobacter sp. LM 6]AOL94377.1 hypothetical protein BG023_111444 [Porphyrobacter sp. LM 6]
MQINPELVRLRSEPAPQPATDAALARWRASPDVVAVSAALAQWQTGVPLAALPALARLVSDLSAASCFAEAFIAPLLGALTDEPLAQLPLGFSAAPGMARLRLLGHARAGLSLTVLAPRPRSVPPAALFEDGEAHEIAIAGAGQVLVHHLSANGLESHEIACVPGTKLARLGTRDARQIIAITRPLVLLQLTCEAARPEPSREIALADLRLLKTISGCKRTSQQMMALGVLGALGHRSALATMTGLAEDPQATRDLRWEALRQTLALDASEGLALLTRLAERADDAIGAPAAALRRDLLATRPDLAALLPETA